MQSIWGAESIFITENGCAASDVVAADGRVYDTDRVMFLRAGLGQLQRATSEGVPVDGYFLWSAQDNVEWIYGYGNRFGLIYVDSTRSSGVTKRRIQTDRLDGHRDDQGASDKNRRRTLSGLGPA
jgi:beta-glucosidase